MARRIVLNPENFQNIESAEIKVWSLMEESRNNQVSTPDALDLTAVELPTLLLASSSPRRSEILRLVGWPFQTVAVEVDESLRTGEAPDEYVERLARAKAQDAATRHANQLILAADTTVVVDEQILAKPGDADEARQMLRLLQGRWHQVLTGVAFVINESSQVAHEVTEVRFASMSEAEIAWYAASGEPMDKAGAYAIQGQGARFIKEIKGDYFNVMGLPVRLLYELINRNR
jgi:septum formation protein